jgi:hypothetical protein
MADLSALRSSIATALEDAGRVVYAYPNEQIALPALVLVPGSPYIEIQNVGGATKRLKVNLELTACVKVADNQAALVNMETLMLDVLAALPADVNAAQWSQPQIQQVGAQDALTALLNIEAYTSV